MSKSWQPKFFVHCFGLDLKSGFGGVGQTWAKSFDIGDFFLSLGQSARHAQKTMQNPNKNF